MIFLFLRLFIMETDGKRPSMPVDFLYIYYDIIVIDSVSYFFHDPDFFIFFFNI